MDIRKFYTNILQIIVDVAFMIFCFKKKTEKILKNELNSRKINKNEN